MKHWKVNLSFFKITSQLCTQLFNEWNKVIKVTSYRLGPCDSSSYHDSSLYRAETHICFVSFTSDILDESQCSIQYLKQLYKNVCDIKPLADCCPKSFGGKKHQQIGCFNLHSLVIVYNLVKLCIHSGYPFVSPRVNIIYMEGECPMLVCAV